MAGIDWCARAALPALLRLVACDHLGAGVESAPAAEHSQAVVDLGLLVWGVTRDWRDIGEDLRRLAGTAAATVTAGARYDVDLLQLLARALAGALPVRSRPEAFAAADAVVAYWTVAADRQARVQAGWLVEQRLRGDDLVAGVVVAAELVERLCIDVVLTASVLARRLASLSGLSVQESSAPLAVVHTQLAMAFGAAEVSQPKIVQEIPGSGEGDLLRACSPAPWKELGQ